jgi:hypothetical protein
MNMTRPAMQAALGAEIGARLGYMHKSQSWLQREAGFSAKSWQRWFLHCDRDLPMGTLMDIARVLEVDASVLLAAAQENAPRFEPKFMGLKPDEQANLEAAVAENMPPADPPPLRVVEEENGTGT